MEYISPRSGRAGLKLITIFLALLALAAAVILSSPPVSQAYTSCKPPRGPGDNLVHSERLRATGVTCSLARHVVLQSNYGPGTGAARFGQGEPFDVGGYTWRCYATEGPERHQHCSARPHKVVTIIWID